MKRSGQEAELEQQKLLVTLPLDCHMINHSLTRRRGYHPLFIGLKKKTTPSYPEQTYKLQPFRLCVLVQIVQGGRDQLTHHRTAAKLQQQRTSLGSDVFVLV